jgi:nucleotide-binding universal stress UspA family protein
LAQDAERIVSTEAKQLDELGWRIRTLVRKGHVTEQIVKAASELGCELVVAGSHGMTGPPHFLLGSVAQKLVKYVGCSVLVGRVRDKSAGSDSPDTGVADFPPVQLLLAFDGSEPARAAVELLSTWPLRDRVEITVVGVQTVATTFYRMDIVEQTSETWLRRKQELQAELDAAAERLRRATPHVSVVLREDGPDPSREILHTAGQLDADLIVVGDKGKRGIGRFLPGSVSNRMVRHSDRSVLVVRP